MSSQPPSSSPLPTFPSLGLLERLVREAGFENFGFAELRQPFSIGLYEEWLSQGHHGEMGYLVRHLPEKREPQRLLAKAQTAIVVTQSYVPHPAPIESWPLSNQTRVAAYAKGRDYHHFLSAKLRSLVKTLQVEFPQEQFLTFTDSGPVLERDLAARAGLGWVGKNTCLIDRKHGSLFFLAEIYTTLTLPVASIPEAELTRDFCGTCTRCLEACPTGALKAPRVLDARSCISYLTIESRTVPEAPLREKIGDWLFGCDICQTVCPWNLKAHGRETLQALHPQPRTPPDRLLAQKDEAPGQLQPLIEDLRFLLSSPNRQLERAFAGTPLSRSGGVGLKRNALIVAANLRLDQLRPEILLFQDHEKLGELARWALEKIDSVSPKAP